MPGEWGRVEGLVTKPENGHDGAGAEESGPGDGGTGSARPDPRPRVLVIDDEMLLGQTLQLGLEETLAVELALTAKAGLSRLETETFRLILCDLSLPDLSGIEVYEFLVRNRPELARVFVVMTGGAMTPEAQSFLENHAGMILHKPFTLSDVEAIAFRVMGE